MKRLGLGDLGAGRRKDAIEGLVAISFPEPAILGKEREALG
jgi:hypothetical protein